MSMKVSDLSIGMLHRTRVRYTDEEGGIYEGVLHSIDTDYERDDYRPFSGEFLRASYNTSSVRLRIGAVEAVVSDQDPIEVVEA